MKIYDLRSDTITKPSAAMRKAMAEAEVGDDVYREDPTVNRLEAMMSERLGKEAALFVSSGSMGNLIPLYLLAGRGSEVLAHSASHIIQHEIGAISAIAGAMPIGVNAPRGILSAPILEPLIKAPAYDMAKTSLIEVENTIGGICYPLKSLQGIRELADRYGLAIHLDGARLFNAAVATGVDISQIAATSDTVTVCLSKGLGAPVGSLLCGSADFVEEARRVRKILGGGMRQAGILAAAGIYALDNNVGRLAVDHQGAQEIASALKKSGWAKFDPRDVETNIIFFSVEGVSGDKVVELLKKRGILASANGDLIRMVTNLNLSSQDIYEVCGIILGMEVEDFE